MATKFKFVNEFELLTKETSDDQAMNCTPICCSPECEPKVCIPYGGCCGPTDCSPIDDSNASDVGSEKSESLSNRDSKKQSHRIDCEPVCNPEVQCNEDKESKPNPSLPKGLDTRLFDDDLSLYISAAKERDTSPCQPECYPEQDCPPCDHQSRSETLDDEYQDKKVSPKPKL